MTEGMKDLAELREKVEAMKMSFEYEHYGFLKTKIFDDVFTLIDGLIENINKEISELTFIRPIPNETSQHLEHRAKINEIKIEALRAVLG